MVFEKVREIVAEQLGATHEEITMEASLIDDLGADSLDIVEIVMAVEEEFDLEIGEDDLHKLQTVGDIVNYVTANI
jgi:acyl carrier protein